MQGLLDHINAIFKCHGHLDPATIMPFTPAGPTLAPFDPLAKAPTVLEVNRIILPSSRVRTTHLRPAPGEMPTCEPDALARIICPAFGQIWGRQEWPDCRQRVRQVEQALASYDTGQVCQRSANTLAIP